MKKYCDNNPENKKLLQLNLPSISNLASHQHYQMQKKQRKNIEKKRKVLEETVAILKRQAQQTNKKLKQTQDELMYTYNKKLTTLEQTIKKNQFKRAQQEQLQQKRNYSNLSRYLHSVKKQETHKDLTERKKNIMREVKSNLEEAHSRKKRQTLSYLNEVYVKAKKMNETNRSNVKWAQQKTLQQKHRISKSVRNNLISIQQSLIAKEGETIQKLQREKKNIIQLLQKNKEKHSQVEDMKQQLASMDLYDFESRIIQNKQQSRITNATRRISKSRKKSKQQKNYSTIYV